MDNLQRGKYIIAAIALIFLVGLFYFLFIFNKEAKKADVKEVADEIKQLVDIEIAKRPFVSLTPTSDGAEIIISVENMSYFDRIEYELTYLADNPTVAGNKIQRGSTGTDVNTKDQKYKKSILLGTASRGVRSPDRGITDGILTMHMFKGETEYQSESQWDLFNISSQSGILSDRSDKLTIETSSFSKNYWVILAETLGIPLSPPFDVKNVQLPIIGAFSVAPDFAVPAKISIKVADNLNPQLFIYTASDSKWKKLESNYDSSAKEINSKINSFGTFAVVSAQ
ncbi:hypothetical protein A3F02_02795 [Candidatus Curtissbacteria bacterium RIFCSPHIGHO2_12_FULL_38_9b]|uniref:Uncharacterized protein n=1 Tax=Candidatus Curtissbacteria bacterium RIFCSPHIGHO2_12_FULL_38_9b TaxID=1797720 RepID=A0A1F5GYY0_9BACT|nr:MAG: hypothetical protein A3F02_02795 [Candidatus Curtissbacteria bacterium RIFCSPHIGHO2_12_FULL_38_9b]